MSISHINKEIIDLVGYTGDKTRHLYNNLCNLDKIKFLEVGTWHGSSLISSLYNNNAYGIAIDNWSEFGGNKENLLSNTDRFLKKDQFSLVEKDAFKIDESDIPFGIDIYLYDGEHESINQKMGITYFEKFLSKYSIIIVDDWSWDKVKNGTYEGLEQSNLTIHHKIEHESTDDKQGYWNGFAIFVCEKN